MGTVDCPISQFLPFSTFQKQLTEVIIPFFLNDILLLSSGTPPSLGFPPPRAIVHLPDLCISAQPWPPILSPLLMFPTFKTLNPTCAQTTCRFVSSQTSHLDTHLYSSWLPGISTGSLKGTSDLLLPGQTLDLSPKRSSYSLPYDRQ